MHQLDREVVEVRAYWLIDRCHTACVDRRIVLKLKHQFGPQEIAATIRGGYLLLLDS
ncbi:MAG: hypothetical protein K8S98_09405 [Planctomycetes bacterium]|nr:hypothetical protein [Planctomycetota bacterium]